MSMGPDVPCHLNWCKAYWEKRLAAAILAERDMLKDEIQALAPQGSHPNPTYRTGLHEGFRQAVGQVLDVIRVRTAQEEGEGK